MVEIDSSSSSVRRAKCTGKNPRADEKLTNRILITSDRFSGRRPIKFPIKLIGHVNIRFGNFRSNRAFLPSRCSADASSDLHLRGRRDATARTFVRTVCSVQGL